MIKRLTVFVLFIVHCAAAMEVNREYCLGCQESFNYEERKQIPLVCVQSAQNLLRKPEHSRSEKLIKEVHRHSLCLQCVRLVLNKKKVLCSSCLNDREITLDEAYEIEAISFFEYYKNYLQAYGKWGWAKLVAVHAVLSDFGQDIDDNTHPLAIELSALLN